MRRSVRVRTGKRARSPEPADPPPRLATAPLTRGRPPMPRRAATLPPSCTATPPRRTHRRHLGAHRLGVQRRRIAGPRLWLMSPPAGSWRWRPEWSAQSRRWQASLMSWRSLSRSCPPLQRGASARRTASACYVASDHRADKPR